MEDIKTEIKIEVRDPENQLIQLIDYIRKISGPGHSFEVIVDPDDSELKKSFFIDGDGAFFISKIEKDKRIFKLKEALKRIQK